MRYHYTPPKYFECEEVSFLDWHNNPRQGIITHVETKYGCKRNITKRTVFRARHTYTMYIPGRRHNIYIGEKRILARLT